MRTSEKRVRIPPRESMQRSNEGDPLDYYYHPLVGYFYRLRLQMVSDLMEGPYPRLLDIGGGSGIFLPHLCSRAGRVTLVDIHQNFSNLKRLLVTEKIHADFACGNLMSLPFADSSFDAINCVSVLEDFEDTVSAERELWRVLKPGGRLFLGVPAVSFLMKCAFALLGEDQDSFHPSTHTKILGIMSGRWTKLAHTRFPSFPPFRGALYHAVAYQKPPS